MKYIILLLFSANAYSHSRVEGLCLDAKIQQIQNHISQIQNGVLSHKERVFYLNKHTKLMKLYVKNKITEQEYCKKYFKLMFDENGYMIKKSEMNTETN
ncbi:MAG: hypothetical protein OXK80_00080 [Bdellovibrionales bacterium]|nr:hypothetical protein [Bdellovibrionales bacterium]